MQQKTLNGSNQPQAYTAKRITTPSSNRNDINAFWCYSPILFDRFRLENTPMGCQRTEASNAEAATNPRHRASLTGVRVNSESSHK